MAARGEGTDADDGALRLVFRLADGHVRVDDDRTGAWVANVYCFNRPGGALIRHNYSYRDRLGRGPCDRHGAGERRAVVELATEIYADFQRRCRVLKELR